MAVYHRAVLLLTLALSITVNCQKRRARPNPMASALLQNILSSSNPEGTMQLLRMAGAKRGPYLKEEIVSNRLVPLLANQKLPRNVVVQNEMPRFQTIPLGSCPNTVPFLPELVPYIPGSAPFIPERIPFLPGQVSLVPERVPFVPGPVSLMPERVPFRPAPVTLLPERVSIIQERLAPEPVKVPASCPGPVTIIKETVPGPQATPARLVNPFLPAASPVSAIAPPTSNLLPPANINNCRCNYLRKIPIPPPSL